MSDNATPGSVNSTPPSPLGGQPSPAHTFPNPPSETAQEPVPVLDTPVDEVDEDEDDDLELEPAPVEDLTGNYSARGEYSAADLVAALDFAQKWNAASKADRDTFSDLMNIWGNQAEIIFGLHPSGGRISNVEFILEVHSKNTDEDMSRADIRQWGITFASRVTEMDPETIRAISKMLNALTPADYPELRYRRNMSSLDTIELLSDAVDALDDQAIKTLNWATEMLAVWPGQIQ